MTDQLSDDLRQLFHLKEVQDFLIAAQGFIDLLEDNNLNEEDFYKETHLSLLSLYAAGMHLPDVELTRTDAKKYFARAKLLYPQKELNLSKRFGRKQLYHEIFNPSDPLDQEPIQGWLVDDYDDIYRDIKIEVEKIKLGTNEAVEDALWQLKFGLEHHWGDHCITALRALHYFKYNNYGY